MVQIINPSPYAMQQGQIGQSIGMGIGKGFENAQQRKQQGQLAKALFGDQAQLFSQIPIEEQLRVAKLFQEQSALDQKTQNQNALFQEINSMFGNEQENQSQQVMGQDQQQSMIPSQQTQQQSNRNTSSPNLIPTDKIAKMALLNPAVADKMQKFNDNILAQQRHQEKMAKSEYEGERAYHTQFSKESEKEAEGIRSNLGKKEMSLNLSRDAVESGEVGSMSLANLAQRLGVPEFQTMKGAQLETAIKENLLSNMSRVSAKGQNIWFEKRLNSMMAQIGKSEEANLAAQEILEGEVAMDKAYLNNFDRLSEEDMKNYGFVKKDVSRRAHEAASHQEKDIFKRTSYRLRELEEQEKGLKSLKEKIGKPVSKNTPLTLSMAKLYKDKFGKEALNVAKENGYYIPTLEEFESFRATPQEFRGNL